MAGKARGRKRTPWYGKAAQRRLVRDCAANYRANLRDRTLKPDGAGGGQGRSSQKLTKLLGDDNLVGSAGEFGLLFAFLANTPDAHEEDGEPAVSVTDLETMFVQEKLPSGWELWRKTRADWVRNTTALLMSAGREYLKLKGQVP